MQDKKIRSINFETAIQKVNWQKVLQVDLHIADNLPAKELRKEMIAAMAHACFSTYNLPRRKGVIDYFFFKSMPRDDYRRLFNTIISGCNNSKIAVDLDYAKSLSPKFRAIIKLHKFRKFLSLFNRNRIVETLYIKFKLVFYIHIAELVWNHIHHKALVVFADMQPIDNLLVQLAKIKGQKNVTMQHGLYIDYTKKPNLNKINYENATADCFLAWGEATASLINQYHPEIDTVVCGKPTLKIPKNSLKDNYFTVLFDQNMLIEENRAMLRIAYEVSDALQLPLNIRFHPRNNPARYRVRKSTRVNRDVMSSKFVVAHTTSMIHEMMKLGMAVFKYQTDIPALPMPEELSFATAEELLQKLKILNSEFSPEEYAKFFIDEIDTVSLAKYSTFFDNFHKQAYEHEDRWIRSVLA